MAKPKAKKTINAPAKKRKRKGVKLESTALTAPEMLVTTLDESEQALADDVRADGGAVLGA